MRKIQNGLLRNKKKNDELYHYGVLGMKWGVRRYHSSDGSLTEKGKKRYAGTLKKKRRAARDASRIEFKVDKLKQKGSLSEKQLSYMKQLVSSRKQLVSSLSKKEIDLGRAAHRAMRDFTVSFIIGNLPIAGLNYAFGSSGRDYRNAKAKIEQD